MDRLLAALSLTTGTVSGRRGGARHLLRAMPEVRELARSDSVRRVAEAALGPGSFAVRAILLDKSPGPIGRWSGIRT